MKQLEDITQRLKSDPLFAVTVERDDPFNAGKRVAIVRNMSGAAMVAQYGTVEAFWERMYANGVRDVEITMRKQNGSKDNGRLVNYKTVDQPIRFRFEENGKAASEQPQAAQHFAYPQAPQLPPPGMNAPGMMGGLNAADIYRAMDHPRLIAELEAIKAKAERLEERNKELEKENYRLDLNKGNTGSMIDAFKESIPHLPALMAAWKGGTSPEAAGSVAGLMGTDTHELSRIIRELPDMADMLTVIANGVEDNEQFGTELVKLLQKYNLVQQPQTAI